MPPPGFDQLSYLASKQYAGVNVTTREEGVEAISRNLAMVTYKAICQVRFRCPLLSCAASSIHHAGVVPVGIAGGGCLG